MKLENTFTIEAPVDKAWEALNTPEMIAPCFPGATLTEYEGDSFTGTVKVKLGPISLTYKGKGTYVERDEAAHRVVIEAAGRDSRGNGTANATVTGSLVADGADKTAVTMVTDMTITGRPAQFGRGVISDVADKIIGQFASCVATKLSPQEDGAASTSASADSGTPGAGTGPPAADTGTPEAGSGPAGSSASPAGMAEAAGSSNGAAASGGTAAATATGPAPSAVPAAAAPTPAATSSPGPVAAAAPRSTEPLRSEIDAIDLLDTAGAPVLKRLAPVAAGGLLLLLVILLVRRLRA